MTSESSDSSNVPAPPKGPSARNEGGSNCTPPANTADPRRTFTGYGLALLACLALFSALHWWWYPDSVDRYYHIAVIRGMQQAGGLPVWDFWNMAPGGRAHLYPPALHVAGYLMSFADVSPAAFITFMSWVLWPTSLFTTWLWMRKVFGPRPALAVVILLSGPIAVFWNQTAFNAIAFGMALAPLALLALESERFLACAVLNLLASTAHPMALFLPPALVINTLLRRKKLLAGLLAACLPMLLYAPWLAHIWANRGSLPGPWNDNDFSFTGIDAGSSLTLGVALTLAACLGIFWLVVRRREALGLLGPLLGSAIVFPLGFGGHFMQFNIHWLLACLGGYGAGMFLEWLERKLPHGLSAVRVVSAALAFFVLTTWVAVEIQVPKKFGGLGEPVGSGGPEGPVSSGGSVKPGRSSRSSLKPDSVPEVVRLPVRFTLGMSVLAKLLNPAGYIAPVGGEPGRPGRIEMIQQKGAAEFLEAIKKQVAVGEIIYMPDGSLGPLLTAATGCWTTGGILRDARPSEARTKPESCQFLVNLSRRQAGGGAKLARTFTKVFGNSFGTLYKNKTSLPRAAPVKAVVPSSSLVVLAVLGIGLVLFDLWLPRERMRYRFRAAGLAFLLASSCLAKLAWTTKGELLHPPKVLSRDQRTIDASKPMGINLNNIPGKLVFILVKRYAPENTCQRDERPFFSGHMRRGVTLARVERSEFNREKGRLASRALAEGRGRLALE